LIKVEKILRVVEGFDGNKLAPRSSLDTRHGLVDCPMRENIMRRIVLISVIVLNVEYEPLPIRFLSTTMNMLKFSMASASGLEYSAKSSSRNRRFL